MNPPRASIRESILRAAKEEASPTRAVVGQRNAVARALFLLAAGGLLALTGGVHVGPRPIGLVVVPVLVWLFAVGLSYGIAFGSRTMNGAPRARLVRLAVALPILVAVAFFVTKASTAAEEGVVPASTHVVCAILTCTIAFLALVTFAMVRGRIDAVHPRATGALIGAVSGVLGAVWANLHCSHCASAHVTVAHLVPVFVFAALGAASGARLFGLASRRS